MRSILGNINCVCFPRLGDILPRNFKRSEVPVERFGPRILSRSAPAENCLHVKQTLRRMRAKPAYDFNVCGVEAVRPPPGSRSGAEHQSPCNQSHLEGEMVFLHRCQWDKY